MRSTRLIASGKNLKRSIQNTPSMSISVGNLSRGKRTFSILLRVWQKPDYRFNKLTSPQKSIPHFLGGGPQNGVAG
jgi:hypothetical protein